MPTMKTGNTNEGSSTRLFRSRNYLTRSMNITSSKIVNVLVPLLKHASERCSDGGDFNLDMQDIFQRFELDVSFKSITSHDPTSLLIDSLPDVPVLGAIADSEKSIIYRFALPEYLWKLQLLTGIGPENQIRHACGIVHRYISNIIVSKRQQHDEQGINNSIIDTSSTDDEDADLLTLLMKDLTKSPHHQSGSDLKDDDAFFRDTVLHQLVAARDTTSSALTWFLWLIVTHPQVEEKIRSEISTHIIIPGGANAKKCHVFTTDETSKLLYLQAALNESMRLYPPASFHCKSPREPDVLPSASSHRVHPTTKIVIPLYAMARMKAIWGDNCSVFEPGRRITERGTIKHEPASKFFVFYAGPRSCMGKEVAMIQMKMLAATLIHNFQFRLVEGQNIEPDISMILHMKHGLKMRVYNRW